MRDKTPQVFLIHGHQMNLKKKSNIWQKICFMME
mgnify:CR=1 FL=1|jgi:hypothetical protein